MFALALRLFKKHFSQLPKSKKGERKWERIKREKDLEKIIKGYEERLATTELRVQSTNRSL